MGMFTESVEEQEEVSARRLAIEFRKRRRYLQLAQKTQRKGGVAWKQWQQAINENYAMFEKLQRVGMIRRDDSLFVGRES